MSEPAWKDLLENTQPRRRERAGQESQGMGYKNQQSTDSIYLWKQTDTAMGMVGKRTMYVIWSKLLNLVEPQFPHL